MKIGVIADDLTGANATGVRLNNHGFPAATAVDNNVTPDSQSLNAVCIDTDSRYATDFVVENRVKKAIKRLNNWGATVICKRIDSTIRGNIGLEIDTVLSELKENSIAIVVASFPDSDRISSGGYLLVDRVPVQETDVAKDPLIPITQSFIPAIIQGQSKNPVGHIGLNQVLQGSKVLQQSLNDEMERGNRIIVVDGVTDEDIEVVAESMASIQMSYPSQIVPVDPGPLTSAYAAAMSNHTAKTKKVIATIGSMTSISGRQLHYLTDKTNSSPVYISAECLASYSSSWDEEINRSVNIALERIHKDDVLILTTHIEGQNSINLEEKAAKENASKDGLAKRITDGLAKITRQVMESTEYSIQGCFTSGGDVTASLVAVFLASGIHLNDEVLPLAAYGTMIGGHFPDLPIVTKGGMVGDKQAIYTSVKYLKTKGVE